MEFDKPIMKSDLEGKLIVDMQGVPALVSEWISLIETETTERMCKCKWSIHPDDVNVSEGCCRICANDRDDHEGPNAADHDHEFKGRRKMRDQIEHPECPVHSKSGLILGFLEWALEVKQIQNGG